MIVGTAAERPEKPAVGLLDPQIVDAGDAPAHFAGLVEFPVLVAVAAEPMAAVVVPLIGKTHRNAIVAERPQFLDQAIIEFAVPLARQERHDGVAALQELHAVAPAAVGRIGERHLGRIARVPGILCHADLLRGSFSGEWRERWAAHGFVLVRHTRWLAALTSWRKTL